MKFQEYLRQKKIDPKKFHESAPAQFMEWKVIFDQVHPDSFTQQKLFLINQVRRMYKLEEAEVVTKSAPKPAMRPKIKPLKPKTS